MIPKECKRLAEVDFPIAAVSKHSAEDKHIENPPNFPWHEATKVQHYWLEVNTMTGSMMVREEGIPYG